jgi:asparagine synthetase B (glutamine-hydrolysing)
VEEEDLSNFIHKFSFANRSNRYSVALPNAQRHFVDYGYPGLSRRLVDLYLRIPPSYKVGAAFLRTLLSRFAPEAARVPWVKTGRSLDRNKTWTQRLADGLSLRQVGSLALLRATGGRWDVSHRADLNRHFRRHQPFRRAHLAIADDERTFARGMIDPAGLRRLTGMIDAGWPVFFLLQSLVTVELFHRRFID